MSKFEQLPELLGAALVEASAKIGPERALIALQGIVHNAKPIRVIDGVLRKETIEAVEKAVQVSGIETIVGAFVEKVEHRFPGTFEVDEDDDVIAGELPVAEAPADIDEDLVPVVAPRRKRRTDG
ncbi:hypothetical protein [Shinella zoogloeoides]|uniref:hypothetical protein n=1 Tax=Shinella zoogloeoides TaxID=352475 RepID=UPI00273D0575|nr:hypothetical protein [Shinella zoogloeoides]WLR91017.1 hypothetical protein Q9316_00280 [Shinella zoogloeoides]